jgi:hypothetical protein
VHVPPQRRLCFTLCATLSSPGPGFLQCRRPSASTARPAVWKTCVCCDSGSSRMCGQSLHSPAAYHTVHACPACCVLPAVCIQRAFSLLLNGAHSLVFVWHSDKAVGLWLSGPLPCCLVASIAAAAFPQGCLQPLANCGCLLSVGVVFVRSSWAHVYTAALTELKDVPCAHHHC